MRNFFFIALLLNVFFAVAQIECKWEFSSQEYLDLSQKGQYSLLMSGNAQSGTASIENNAIYLTPSNGSQIEKVLFFGSDRTSVRFEFLSSGKVYLGITQTNKSGYKKEFVSENKIEKIPAKQATSPFVWFVIGGVIVGLLSFFVEKRGAKLFILGMLFFSEVAVAQNINAIVPNQGITSEGVFRGALGMIVLVFIAFMFSSNRKAINWRSALMGLALQLFLAIGVLKVDAVRWFFEKMGGFFVLILDFTKKGSEFVFGGLVDVNGGVGYIFAFQVLPTIIFFSALTSILFYYGIIQIVMRVLAWCLSKLLGISGAESLSVAGNVFLGQTEAPLMIKSYLPQMTKSEILLVMTGGMATVAGGVLASYISFLGGNDPVQKLAFAKHLLAASVMAAPGAVVISKILYPQTEKYVNNYKTSEEQFGANILDVISNGTTEGLKLAANVGAMLLVFVALMAMCNHMLGWIGDITSLNSFIAQHTPYETFSVEMVLGMLFSPVMWIIGVAQEDVMLMGQLLGIKLAASEFVGYIQLAELKNIANATHFTYEKSIIMGTYMLCGFANFASIGIQIGGIGSLAPSQRTTLSEFGLRSVLGGTLASLLSATMAGMIIG